MENARNVRLDGSTLYADLKSSEHTWNAASIDLNVVIGNDNGRLVNGKHSLELEPRLGCLISSIIFRSAEIGGNRWRRVRERTFQKILGRFIGM
jgi:hypothetical protein